MNILILLTDVTYSEWQYKKYKNTETKLKSKSFQIQWVYSFFVFSLTPLNCFEVTGKIYTANMFILLTYVTYSEWQYKKIQNTETKLKSKSFQIQWVYSFFVFSLTPLNCFEVTGKIYTANMFILLTYVTYSEWQYKKIQNTETKLKSKSFQIQWVYSFFVFSLTPLNCFEVTGKIYTANMFILLTYVTYSEWQYKKIQNTETKLKSKCFQIQWVYSFFVFSLTPLNCFEVTGKIYTANMFILLTDVTYSEWQYKKIQNTETKLKSKSFEIQWVYSFCVFSL
jgi:hypothetical protein